eukprot:COSAG06_NODE_15060_length_1100_cov_1.667333_1_plen_104_part_00
MNIHVMSCHALSIPVESSTKVVRVAGALGTAHVPNEAGNAIAHPAYTAVEMVGSNGFPADGAYAQGTIYACLRHCELHVAYASPQMPIIPSSVQQRPVGTDAA